jgi:hypothetical protein
MFDSLIHGMGANKKLFFIIAEVSPAHLKFFFLLKKVFYWPPNRKLYGAPYMGIRGGGEALGAGVVTPPLPTCTLKWCIVL